MNKLNKRLYKKGGVENYSIVINSKIFFFYVFVEEFIQINQ
jgi:L-rhamnose mutarotase